MKNNTLPYVILCFIINTRVHAQYGELNYLHPNSFLSSAKTTNINTSGFVMAGNVDAS